jgi:hypothetical protein
MLSGRKNQVSIITITLMIIVLSAACKSRNTSAPPSAEEINKSIIIPLYRSMEIEVSGRWISVPVADKYILLDPKYDRITMLNHIAAELSSSYFNGLKIEIGNIENNDSKGGGGMISINLAEAADYSGPGSVRPYHSWYDFFQGSAGGTNTSIILRESFLQRTYKGEWFDSVQFSYMGEPFPESDHVQLSGIITRY